MEYVAPGAACTSRLLLSPSNTGLVGTVRFRLLDNDTSADDPVYGPVTAGVVEDPSGSGSYVIQYAAPTTAGKYTPTWDTGVGTQVMFDEEIVVTRTAVAPATPSGNEYITRSQLKARHQITSTDFDDLIDRCVIAASAMVENHCGTVFYTTAETRYFTASKYDQSLRIDDLCAFTSLAMDFSGDGTWETWTRDTDFKLEPLNAEAKGLPWNRVVLMRQARYEFATYLGAVKVVGTWGWLAVPGVVTAATEILASRLWMRKDSPFGIVTLGLDGQASMKLSKTDPDVAAMLDDGFPGRRKALLV